MKFSNKTIIKTAAVQAVFAMCSSFFFVFQADIIDGLEQGKQQAVFYFVTGLCLLGSVLFQYMENAVREKEFAVFVTEQKKAAGKYFLNQKASLFREKEQAQHLSFFISELDTVLNENCYLRLYGMRQMIMLLFALGALFWVSLPIGLAVSALSFAFWLLTRRTYRKLPEKQQKFQESIGRFMDRILELYRGYEEIHINQMEEMAYQDFCESCRETEQARYHYMRGTLRTEVMTVGNNMMIYLLILALGGLLALNGMTGLGILISGAELAVSALNQWVNVVKVITKIRATEPLKKQLEEKLAESGRETETRAKDGNTWNYAVEITNLSYSYEGQEQLFGEVNMTLEKGKKYLLMGSSGSGKSTLLEILAGHMGESMPQCRCSAEKLVYIPQKPFLFQGTLLENITLGREDREEEAGKLLDKLCLNLPLTQNIEEDGKNLSAGQQMRLAIARALCEQPDLLLADEVTAALDERTARAVEELLLTGYPDMTVCAAAHRVFHKELFDGFIQITDNHIHVLDMPDKKTGCAGGGA